MDFNYIRKLPVKWVRTTSRILDYVDGKLNAISDTATQRVVDTSKMGYQVAFDLTASGEYVKNPLVYADFLRLLQH